MTKVWAAVCKNKNCRQLSGVRLSKSHDAEMDLKTPSEKILNQLCPFCGEFNDFLGSDLSEYDAKILPSPPENADR
jgi:hypothetical protein